MAHAAARVSNRENILREGVFMHRTRLLNGSLSLICWIIISLCHTTHALATSYSTDQSDLWYNKGEAGWGIQFVQRGSVIFATMFVYDAANKPTWFTALLAPTNQSWTGDLYETNGPWFGSAVFSSAAVSRRTVGTMTWQNTGEHSEAGTLTYSVDGTQVRKNIVRQTLVLDDYSGSYTGMLSWRDCGGSREDVIDLTVTQAGDTITVMWFNTGTGMRCSYPGTLTQEGQFGSFTGSFSCTSHAGSFTIYELQVTQAAISGRLHDEVNGCITEAYFGGTRHR